MTIKLDLFNDISNTADKDGTNICDKRNSQLE